MKTNLSKILLWHEFGAIGLKNYMRRNGIQTIVNDYSPSLMEYEADDIEESYEFFLLYLPKHEHN